MQMKELLNSFFLKGNERPEMSYSDRKGKYMGQTGVTLPKKYNKWKNWRS